MEDRYLYKAKTTPKEKGEFNNVWVTGNLIVSNEKYYIHPVGNIVKVRNEIGRMTLQIAWMQNAVATLVGMKAKQVFTLMYCLKIEDLKKSIFTIIKTV